MRQIRRSSTILGMGVCLSLSGHALVGIALARSQLGLPPSGGDKPLHHAPQRDLHPHEEPPAPPDPSKPKPPRELRLGLDDGSAATLTWLGFTEATEHQARKGVVEQSALTLNPSPSGPESPATLPPSPPPSSPDSPSPTTAAMRPELPAPPTLQPEIPLTTAEPIPEPVADATPEPLLPPALPEALEAISAVEPLSPAIDPSAAREVASTFAQAALAAGERISDRLQRLLEPAPPPSPPRLHQSQQAPTPQSAAPPAPPTPAPGGGAPGIASDRESIAVSAREAPAIRPGKVLAAKGLKIQTRRPRFDLTTLLTRQPLNPTVEIRFDRSGRVVRAEFLREGSKIYSTGAAEIDQPLLNAIYSWSATGKDLEDLPADDPSAGITVIITVILVG